MSQSGASPKDSEISTPSPRSEIINTQKNKLDFSKPDIFLMKTLLSKEDESEINTITGVTKKTLLSLPIESMIITKERKSEHQKYPIAGKESVLPTEMILKRATRSEEDSWKDPLGEILEGSSIEILTACQSSFPINTQSSSSKLNLFQWQKFLFPKFILPAKELPLPQRVYKNPKAKHSNIKYKEKIQSNLVPIVQKKHLRLSAPRELVAEHYQEATRIKCGGSKQVRGKIIHDTDCDEYFYSEAVGSSPLKDKVERNNKGKSGAESLDLSIYSLGQEKGAISRPGSRVRYSSPLAKFSTGAHRPNTSFNLWPLILCESSKKTRSYIYYTKKSDGKLNNPSSRLQRPSENSSAKKPILKNPAQPRLQSSSEAEQLESGAEHSSQSCVTGQSSRPSEGIEGEDEEDSPQNEYELETRMRQRKGLRKKTTDKSKRLSKNQRTVVQVHCWVLLGIQDRDLPTIPQPPSAEEREIAIAQAGHVGVVPEGFDTGPSSFVKSKLLKLGLHQFSWDWDSSWNHPFNELMSIIFYKTLDLASLSCEYNNYTWVKEHNNNAIVYCTALKSLLIMKTPNRHMLRWQIDIQ
ncbi:hypothetical protein BY996DRAFT_7108793, partial [Phakopsora pachyrhizi]